MAKKGQKRARRKDVPGYSWCRSSSPDGMWTCMYHEGHFYPHGAPGCFWTDDRRQWTVTDYGCLPSCLK